MGDEQEPENSGNKQRQTHHSQQQDVITQQSDHVRKVLRQISRARTRLMVCLLTLPVYMVAVWFLLENQRSIDSFMFIYMAMWAAFAVDMARRRCPNCGEQFYVKVIFLNLISQRCVHCGLSEQSLITDSDTQRRNF